MSEQEFQSQIERLHWRDELIAELLAALRGVVAISDRKHEAWDRARAAIAKAEAMS